MRLPRGWVAWGFFLSSCTYAAAAPDSAAEQADVAPIQADQRREAALLHQRGYEYVRKADYDQAIECFTNGLVIEPENVELLMGRADALLCKGALEDAAMDLSEAVRLNPKNAVVRRGLGICKMRQGAQAAAVDEFGRAIALDPDDHVSFFRRAKCWRALGKNEAALSDLDASLAIQRNYVVFKGARIYVMNCTTCRALSKTWAS